MAQVKLLPAAEEYVIDSAKFVSLGKNTPFNGKKVKGKVKYTIIAGEVVFSEKNDDEVFG